MSSLLAHVSNGAQSFLAQILSVCACLLSSLDPAAKTSMLDRRKVFHVKKNHADAD